MEQSRRNKPFLYTTFVLLGLVYLGVAYNAYRLEHHFALKMLFIYMVFCNFLTFYRSSMTDPGFLNESKYPNFELQPLHFKSTIDVVPDAFNNSRMIYFTESDGSTTTYVQKYCTTCNIFRPHLAAHCNDCGKCVLDKDHHCLWLDNCIGRNNVKMFFSFIITLLILDLYNAFTFSNLIKKEKRMCLLVPILALFLVFIILGMFLIVFVSYNIFLALLDIKSREFLNAPGKINYQIDFKKVSKRLLTLNPAIFSQNSVV